jgi:arsenate reductase-like glutaredoxin family protein
MDFITLIKERYSVRKFSAMPIEKEKLDQVLKASQLAPTAQIFNRSEFLSLTVRHRLQS